MPIRVLATLSKLRGRQPAVLSHLPPHCCVSSALLRDRVLPLRAKELALMCEFFC